MRRAVISILSAGLVFFVASCAQKRAPESSEESGRAQSLAADTLFRVHFEGTDKLFAGTNASALKEIWSAPETETFRNEVLEKLARLPFQIYQKRLAGTNDFADVFRPMLDDALRSEWFLEARGTNAAPEMVLAIRLARERAQLWHTNFVNVLTAWTGIAAVTANGGWEVKKYDPPNLIQFSYADDWVVIAIGQDKLRLGEEVIATIQKNGAPTPVVRDSSLQIAGDFSLLKRWFRIPEVLADSQFHLSIAGKGENLSTKGTVTSRHKFDFLLEPWRVPTNTIREPLVSFTAIRGVRSELEKSVMLRQYGLQPAPNQIYLWALEQIPMQSYAMASCEDATNTLKAIAPKLMSSLSTNLFHRQVGKIVWATNESGLVWLNVPPLVVPFLQPVKEPAGDFLFAGLFPRSQHKNTVPPEILSELNARTNMLYYDWEITDNRILQWQNLASLQNLIKVKDQFVISGTGEKFLALLRQKCGNTITEITWANPNELSAQRKSNAGFTAFELLALTRWLDSTNFPALHPSVEVGSERDAASPDKKP